MNAALDAGIKVPEDLEVMTSNNTKLTLMSRPQLSTIVQPLYDIGAVAMRLLTKLMTSEEVDEKQLSYHIVKNYVVRLKKKIS